MKRVIHHLRKKPEEERRHILHLSVIIIGIILIFLWTLSLGRSITNKDTKIKMKQDLKPFSVLKENMVGGYNSITTGESSNTAE
ncbi:MAG TPA: hypothetical protein PKZ36_02205 [Candidatus Paceibacterota bacterium]|nr:hypothetical protein [Candidatus Paceibacterota bacterium]HPT18196.1 hypothetical protein [Candidatus Paceibacterota bacterium]